MNADEFEVRIKEETGKLAKLEGDLEKEEDEAKSFKLDNKVTRQVEVINRLVDRQNTLLDREAEHVLKDNGKDKNAEEEDEDVCEACGGDLNQVGEDPDGVAIFECEKCGELYLDD